MFAIRYVALVATVVWLGGSVLLLSHTFYTDAFGRFDLIAAACAAVLLVCLFLMKFVGPPPRAFTRRAGIAFVMLVLSLYSGLMQQTSTVLLTINVTLGLVLLSWYARE